ncbi:aquaporin [Candidatus Parcubacteria bacterium]|nr:aquaporin [Candidatus Parcubacteria bacterium]
MKKYLAEALGTFALTLVVALSLSAKFSVATPVLAGLVLMLFVYTIGDMSGSHINPAVTVGLWSIKKIKNNEVVLYVVAQFFGAAAALLLVSFTVGIAPLPVTNSLMVGLAELVGAFFFGFGIASVVYGRTPALFSGVVIGGSLLLGIAIAATLGSNGVLNPAVAFGIQSFNLVYILGPIAGSVLGMQAYKYINL